MVCNWPWFGRTVTGLYCNRVRIGAERFALKVHSYYNSNVNFVYRSLTCMRGKPCSKGLGYNIVIIGCPKKGILIVEAQTFVQELQLQSFILAR